MIDYYFLLPILEYCSAVSRSAPDTHLKQVDRVVSCASFLTVGVFECDNAHRRSVVVLCMLYEIMCNHMHPLYAALHSPCVSVRVTREALVAHRHTDAPPRYRTLQYRKTFIKLSVSLWNDLPDHVFHGVGLAGFKGRTNVNFIVLSSCFQKFFTYNTQHISGKICLFSNMPWSTLSNAFEKSK